MDETDDAAAAKGADPEAGGVKVYSQEEWNLEHERWLCRAWSLSAWPFGIFILTWLFGDLKPIGLLYIGLAGLVILWSPAAFHWYRYSKATGKWFWI